MKVAKSFILLLFISCSSIFLLAQNSVSDSIIMEGINLHNRGFYKEAIIQYEKALKIAPLSTTALYEISFSYFSLKEYEKAIKYAGKVIDKNEDHLIPAYITYGSALDMIGQKRKAIKAFEKGLLDHEHYLLYFNHALSCFNIGNYKDATISCQKAIILNPSHASSHLLFSRIKAQEGEELIALLAAWYFLFLEPSSERSAAELDRISIFYNPMKTEYVEDMEKNKISLMQSDDLEKAKFAIDTKINALYAIEKETISDIEFLSRRVEIIAEELLKYKNGKGEIWWSIYAHFFYLVEKNQLTDAFSYHISQSIVSEDFSEWILENEAEYHRFLDWITP